MQAIQNFTFIAADGIEMPLEEGCSAFITMNPGYIGRAELPESLKVRRLKKVMHPSFVMFRETVVLLIAPRDDIAAGPLTIAVYDSLQLGQTIQAAQPGHACQMTSIRISHLPTFRVWCRRSSGQSQLLFRTDS